jgi:hypothetical protein
VGWLAVEVRVLSVWLVMKPLLAKVGLVAGAKLLHLWLLLRALWEPKMSEVGKSGYRLFREQSVLGY